MAGVYLRMYCSPPTPPPTPALEIAYLPTFDSAVCSKGTTLLSNNTAATLMQFYDAPHPYSLGPVITRGASMQTITLYFGQPALPAMNVSSSSANLQAILRNCKLWILVCLSWIKPNWIASIATTVSLLTIASQVCCIPLSISRCWRTLNFFITQLVYT
jgi:hypothetical protein